MVTPEAIAAETALNHVSSYTYELNQEKFEASTSSIVGHGRCIQAIRKGVVRKMTPAESIQFMRDNHWSNVQKIELLCCKVIASGNTPSVEINTRQTHKIEGKIVTAEVPTTVSFVMDMSDSVPKIQSITYEYAPEVNDPEIEAKLAARALAESAVED